MNKKVYTTLEYDKIVKRLCDFATSDKGREYCSMIEPSFDLEKINHRQQETADALSRIFKQGELSFSGIHDMVIYKKRLEIGSTLSAGELLQIASLLRVTARIASYGRDKKSDAPRDTLDPYFEAIVPLAPLRSEIDRCIITEDEIADDASSNLKNIRKKKQAINDSIRSQMNKMLNSGMREYLQDSVITMRDGRFCLPVKAEYKSYVPGMVHDTSSTGSTIFIEPMAAVNSNNELRELELAELEEINKILAELSNLVVLDIDTLCENFKVLAELDFIFAKGMLAKEMNGVAPEFNTNGIINLRGARHPLLNPKNVVPIDIHIGDTFDMLLVTGPNTGGKTVTLKTVGLLTLMGQAGLHIPTLDRSQLAIFHNVYADIGDEQSIEQSLSTFSSHMVNIIRILDGVRSCRANGHDALVLFDELCAGTDPAEGAALAESILTELHNEGVRVIATTHYSELKLFALNTVGVENASCEFSLETLSPTYRLLIGVPGKSNAFAISQKLGVPKAIIDYAKECIDDSDRSFEDLFIDLEQKRVQIERDLEDATIAKKKAVEKEKQLNEKLEKLEATRERILSDANTEAARLLKEAKKTADETIRNFNKYANSNPDIVKMEQERAKIGEKAKKHQSDAAVKKKEAPENTRAPKANQLHIGDSVKVLSMNLKGIVHTLPDAKGNLQVQMGIMRSNVNIRDLVLIDEDDPYGMKKSKYAPKTKTHSKASTISTEIQLLGLNADDAIAKLDKYLDDAYASNLSTVRVVHGKGTGVLRDAVQKYLKKQPHVAEYHLGEYGEGDAGVTIVTFK